MITYQEESFVDAKDEFAPLLELHWQEVEDTDTGLELDMNYECYEAAEDAGLVYTVTAREGDVLVGYIVNMIVPNLHYKSLTLAVADGLFILPQYRKGTTFIDMLKYAEQGLIARDVTHYHISMKTKFDFSKVLERYNYKQIEHNFEKTLTGL